MNNKIALLFFIIITILTNAPFASAVRLDAQEQRIIEEVITAAHKDDNLLNIVQGRSLFSQSNIWRQICTDRQALSEALDIIDVIKPQKPHERFLRLSFDLPINLTSPRALIAFFLDCPEADSWLKEQIMAHSKIQCMFEDLLVYITTWGLETDEKVALANRILSLGISANATSSNSYHRSVGLNALAGAAENGNIKMVRLLLDHGADIEHICPTKFFGKINALMHAAANGHVEIVRLLLARGANVNAINKEGRTALMFALNVEVAQVLLEVGANPHIKSYDSGSQKGETALERIIRIIDCWYGNSRVQDAYYRSCIKLKELLEEVMQPVPF